MRTLPLFLTVAGLVVGLGAVTVIDSIGFLGRTSPYWTETAIRAHRVTKPLIWIGTGLYALGLALVHGVALLGPHRLQLLALLALVANGCYLSFAVSPALVARERAGRAAELLPAQLQARIAASFAISVAGWWGSVALLAIDLTRGLR